jgi:hypothetical protein
MRESLQDRLFAADAARARTNRFILENLRDTFCAGHPRFVFIGQEPAWIVPVVFAHPDRAVGEVGEVIIQAVHGAVLGFTPPAEIDRNARQLLSNPACE